MRPTVLAALAALALAACSPEDAPRFPALDSRSWRVEGDAVVCDGPTGIYTQPTGAGPYTEIQCAWLRVSYEGQNRCSVTVVYRRADAAAPWPEPLVIATHADCTNDPTP